MYSKFSTSGVIKLDLIKGGLNQGATLPANPQKTRRENAPHGQTNTHPTYNI